MTTWKSSFDSVDYDHYRTWVSEVLLYVTLLIIFQHTLQILVSEVFNVKNSKTPKLRSFSLLKNWTQFTAELLKLSNLY